MNSVHFMNEAKLWKKNQEIGIFCKARRGERRLREIRGGGWSGVWFSCVVIVIVVM